MKTRKEELQKSLRDAQRELSAIEAKEQEAYNKAVLGKCFRYRNCYSCPEKPSDYWWLYARVVKVSGQDVICFEFQTDRYGEIFIRPDRRCYRRMVDGYQQITLTEYRAAWKRTAKRIAGFTP